MGCGFSMTDPKPDRIQQAYVELVVFFLQIYKDEYIFYYWVIVMKYFFFTFFIVEIKYIIE